MYEVCTSLNVKSAVILNRIFFLQIIEYYRSNQEIIFINVLMETMFVKIMDLHVSIFSYFTLRVFHDV